MPAGYVIAQLKVTNLENYKVYVEKVTPLVKKYNKILKYIQYEKIKKYY